MHDSVQVMELDLALIKISASLPSAIYMHLSRTIQSKNKNAEDLILVHDTTKLYSHFYSLQEISAVPLSMKRPEDDNSFFHRGPAAIAWPEKPIPW